MFPKGNTSFQTKKASLSTCLFGLELMMGFDSCRAVAASVIRGSDSPPDCHSLPLLLRIPHFKIKKESTIFSYHTFFFGADDGIRTHDRLITNQLLYQLSHISVPIHYNNAKYFSQEFLRLCKFIFYAIINLKEVFICILQILIDTTK